MGSELLPDEWRWVTLGEVADPESKAIVSGPFGSNIGRRFFVSYGVPVIRGNNLTTDMTRFIDEGFVFVTEEKANELGNCEALPDDLVFTAAGSLGQVGIIPRDASFPRYIISNKQLRARLDKHRVDPLFAFYWFSSSRMVKYIQQRNTGSSVPLINLGILRSLPMPLPPLPEQRAIAHILGTLDDKIELNRQMNATLEAIARALFKSWFVDFDPVRAKAAGEQPPGLAPHIADLFPDAFVASELGEIPKGWEVKSLADICEKPQYGYTASASDEKIGPRFLRITDINKVPWIDWTTVPYCQIEQDQYTKYRLYPGDMLVARMADPGHGVVIEEEVIAVFASYLIRFRPINEAFSRYLQYWLRSPSYWSLVRARQAGTTRASLNAQAIGNFPLLIPDYTVVKAFETLIESLRDKIVSNVRESSTLAALRDTLLPKLISGELRVPDAERIIGRYG